ncbi:hypothetical protein QBC43DRAFT_50450 [Cladorrhinum sp. PSN259]|nr:hypothetical protein QBC43DRAFT_50450 [Cladorrhinum sp. PSN259]
MPSLQLELCLIMMLLFSFLAGRTCRDASLLCCGCHGAFYEWYVKIEGYCIGGYYGRQWIAHTESYGTCSPQESQNYESRQLQLCQHQVVATFVPSHTCSVFP